MSHFVGLLFSDNYELLDKYDENIEVEPYIKYTKEEAVEKAKKDQQELYDLLLSQQIHLKEERNITNEEDWEQVKKWGYKIDDFNNIISTYNPNSKWDWYSVGGRWSGYLPLKDGTFVDTAFVSEVDWDKYKETEISPFCFITPEGDWFESANMGWWCITSNENPSWDTVFDNYLATLDDDTIVNTIDFHI